VRRVPEIVAPAGTPDKLRTVLHFGADAVYLGLKSWSMRAFAGNVTLDQAEWAVAYAHEHGRRVYVTLNIQPVDDDLVGIVDALRALKGIGPDAIVVGDPGVVALAREHAAGIPLHLSTQASVTNSAAIGFWVQQGMSRVIVARELSISQLSRMVESTSVPLEAFVQGAVCVAYSGRCLLSLYGADRDTRRGACAQGCRWAYKEIEDGRRPGLAQRVAQDERGTHFFDAKDLCAMPVLEGLLASGVQAWKIEGRNRSRLYAGVAVDVYRDARDRLVAGDVDGFRARIPWYVAELGQVSQRPFSTHYLGGEQDSPDAYLPGGTYPSGRYPTVGVVEGRRGDDLLVGIQDPLRPGEAIEVVDAGCLREPVQADTLVNAAGEALDLARPGTLLRLGGPFRAQPGALVRRAREAAPTTA